MEFSFHAQQRCDQRGIRQQQVEWLLSHGSQSWNRGAKVYYFDGGDFDRLLPDLTPAQRKLADKARNAYAVVVDNLILTVGRRAQEFCVRKPGAHNKKACHRRARTTFAA
jgi:hypothetical protein